MTGFYIIGNTKLKWDNKSYKILEKVKYRSLPSHT